jgi:hypothetical protein
LDIEDDAYETPKLAYNKKLNLLILVSSITRSSVEEDNSPPFLEDTMLDLEKETTNSENTAPTTTP